MVNGAQPESLQEWRRMLEETKREVREIKAIEAQLKWNMQREETKERTTEEKATVEDVRDWRWRQNEEMKAYRAGKAQIAKVTELRESKTFQEFKREAKDKNKDETRKKITEEYEQDREHATWRAAVHKVVLEREKELVADRVDDHLEHRELRQIQKVQERVEADENRALEQSLEMAAIADEIAKEKEQLLQSLELSRAAQNAHHRSTVTPSAALGRLS